MCPLLVFMDIVGFQWQQGFEPFSQFSINVSQQNFKKENLWHKFVNKVKISTSRFFPMLHHGESPEKPQYDSNPTPHFALPPDL